MKEVSDDHLFMNGNLEKMAQGKREKCLLYSDHARYHGQRDTVPTGRYLVGDNRKERATQR